jgi:hypothetical protein
VPLALVLACALYVCVCDGVFVVSVVHEFVSAYTRIGLSQKI